MSDKAKMKMDAVIWEHGREKAKITVLIKSLKNCRLNNTAEINNCIIALEAELERLKKIELF